MAVGLTISRCPHTAVADYTYHTNMGHSVPSLECIFINFVSSFQDSSFHLSDRHIDLQGVTGKGLQDCTQIKTEHDF